MRRLLFEVSAVLVCQVYDLFERVQDIYAVRILRRHLAILRDTVRTPLAPSTPCRIAIVAIFPTPQSLPFLHNALDGLLANGFDVVIVSNRSLPDDDRNSLLTKAHRIIERPAVGRDFGAYQTGLRTIGLGEQDKLAACETLLLLNDSMFYRSDSTALFREILAQPGDWLSMFENYEYSYHAQSFFMAFRPAVFRSAAFSAFWRDYVPYTSRHYTINAGEVGFSSSMRRAGFVVSAYFNSSRLADMLLGMLGGGQSIKAVLDLLPAAKSAAAGAPGRPGMPPPIDLRFLATQAMTADREAGVGDDQAAVTARWTGVLWEIVRQAEITNPTHFAGLLLNNHATAPLKRDLCYRGTFGIAHVVNRVMGLEEPQRVAMETDLRGKGLPASITGIRKLLFHRGRV